MQVFLTFDYELYFGEHTGSVEKCITGPTDLLTKMADKNGIKLCHFVDIGFLLKMESQLKQFPSLNKDHSLICNQLDALWKNGHDLQLHIHPHWEDSFYDGNKWVCNVERYKLSDFSQQDINSIIKRYKHRLEQFTGSESAFAFRAGGWCIQPFEQIKDPLYEAGIRVDSSVFANGNYYSSQYNYDFRGAPLKSIWKFNVDPLKEEENGPFTELPISSIFNSPLFYWRLFLLGRLHPYDHKPLGDGVPIAAPGQRFALLTRWTHNTVSVDGYNASLLWRALRQHKRNRKNHMVIIGHPKSLTRFGLKSLDLFVSEKKSLHQFTTFREQKENLV